MMLASQDEFHENKDLVGKAYSISSVQRLDCFIGVHRVSCFEIESSFCSRTDDATLCPGSYLDMMIPCRWEDFNNRRTESLGARI
jgi:hypothetical protein